MKSRNHSAAFALRVMLVLCCLLVLSSRALAQDGTPIAIGQNVQGEVTAEVSIVRFALTTHAGDTAAIRVLSITPGFAPRFRVLNPSDVEILAVANPTGLATISGTAGFSDAGTYTIEVGGENGTTGQFLLSLEPGSPLPAPFTLTVGQAVEGVVDSQTPALIYQFDASPTETLLLSIRSKLPDSGPGIALRDQTADRTIATNDGSLNGIAYSLPLGNGRYQVEIHTAGVSSIGFSICLSVETAGGGCGTSPVPVAGVSPTPEALPTVTLASSSSSTCTVASGTGGGVNVRSGPGTEFGIIGSVLPGLTYPVGGQIAGGSWYQVSVTGAIGWVAAAVVQAQGACATVPVVAAPPPPVVFPTSTLSAPPPAAPTTAAPPPPPMPTTAVPPPSAPSGPTATDLPPISDGASVDSVGLDVDVVARPDLVPGGLSVSPIDEDEIGVGFVVWNHGTSFAGPYTIQICNRVACATWSGDPLRDGGSVGSGVILPVDYEHVTGHLVFTVDTGNTVMESNEGNNTREQDY